MNDDTIFDASRPSTQDGHIIKDNYPDKSVNELKAMIEQNNAVMKANGARALTQPEYLAAVARGEHPVTAVEWWRPHYLDSTLHLSMHLKQEKLGEPHSH